jgi:predicted metal-dependent hydrolase
VRPDLHPDLTPAERRDLLRRGVDQFNRGEFYEAHESWEEVWRSTRPEPRSLFQGLIQVAAALHMIRDLHRERGPGQTFAKARERLAPYAPAACGLDVDDLLIHVGRWQEWLEDREREMPGWPSVRVVDREALE